MQAEHLFAAHAESIEPAIVRVCRDAHLDPSGAEDFASSVRLSLLADDCAILRKFGGRSSMAKCLTIVVRRLLVDAQRAEGRSYASQAARRHSQVAVQL